MFRILGSSRTLCDGVTRREILQAGAFGAGTLGLSQLGSAAATPEGKLPASFGKAKRVLCLFLYGAASQHETFDPKPLAPAEVRGEFHPIRTSVPGLEICEHLPLLAQVADRLTVIRSMTHSFPIHSSAYSMTGVDKVDIPMELNPYDSRHWPFFGSVIDYLDRRLRGQTPTAAVPPNVALPFLMSSRARVFKRGGPYGGFLGRTYNPVWTEFDGTATKSAFRQDDTGSATVSDPFLGITPDSRFYFADGGGITLDRLQKRRSLLEQLDDRRSALDRCAVTQSLDRYNEMAFSLIASPQLREALNLEKESPTLRQRYGMTLFGQSTLAGRRLLEAGAKVVTVVWDEYTVANTAWDTHNKIWERLRGELLPGLDQALATLILDLEERGMLEDTLVMVLTEHGRTPRVINQPTRIGRDHWSDVYCGLLAGGGTGAGRVIGSSDKQGATVKDFPVSPKDILCTMYHLLGIDPHTTIPDRLGRPVSLVAGGQVMERLLA
jgi:hypothetical protein